MINLSGGQLTHDIIALEPLEVKSVVLTKSEWKYYRPIIKRLQAFGLWYDVSEYYDKIMVRVKVNEVVENYLQGVLDSITE